MIVWWGAAVDRRQRTRMTGRDDERRAHTAGDEGRTDPIDRIARRSAIVLNVEDDIGADQ